MGLRPTQGAYHKDDKKEAELHARISQETFDSAVQENVDEFDMEPDEALKDAIEQFETQGVNLSNIVKRAPGAEPSDDPAAVVALRELKAALEVAADGDGDEEMLEIPYGGGIMKMTFMKVDSSGAVALAEQAAALRTACQKEKAQLALVTLNGAVDTLVSAALAVLSTATALPPILEALAVVLHDPEGREQLGQRGIAALTSIIRRHADDAGVVRSGMHACRASMLVHENHRQQFVTAAKLLKLIAPALDTYKDDAPTFLATCGALRACTLSDDARSRTSKGLEHAKAAVELKLHAVLLNAARSSVIQKQGASALAELLATLSRLAVTDQICSALADLDALPTAITELANHMTDANVAKQACFFLASISGNDNCKGSIVEGNGHVAIIQAMLLHPNNASMQTDAVSALGNMCLRMPTNCEAIAEADGLPAIVQAFSQHIGFARMQSKGPLAIRNLVSRNSELVSPLLGLGVEAPLREVMAAHADGYVHNLAKAALRELKCDVHLKEQFQGTLEDAHTLQMGSHNDENHWDKFLETPVAQAAIKAEMAAEGITPDGYLDAL